jgi:uncharacterized protein (TIGR02246 family)
MKGNLAFAVLFALALTAGAGEGPSVDQEGLADLAVAFSSAWSRHDPDALASLWTADGDLMNPMGRSARGRAEIRALFEDEHGRYMRGTSLSVKVTSSRALAADLAFVDCEALLAADQPAEGRSAPPLKHVIFAVVAARDGKWRFLSARLAVPIPPPPRD